MRNRHSSITDYENMNRQANSLNRSFAVLYTYVVFVSVLIGDTTARAEHRALLIGVGGYEKASSLKSLPYAVRDVTEFEKPLKERGYVTNMLISDPEGPTDLNQLPTYVRIREKIESFFKVGAKGDSLILAFAGHGVNINKDAYICPVDARVQRKQNMISVDWISEQMLASKATHVTFFCDACQEEIDSGAILRNVQNLEAGVGERFKEKLMKSKLGINQRKVSIFQSCSPGQYASADPELRHGVFFKYLIDGVKGEADGTRDGKLHHRELFDFVSNKVFDHVDGKFGRGQNVYEFSKGYSDMPLLEFETPVSWVPKNAEGPKSARLVACPGSDSSSTSHYFSEVTLTPQVENAGAPSPIMLQSGSPMKLNFVLVPRLRPNDCGTFYISKEKITASQFAAFEKHFPDFVDQEAQRLRAQKPMNPNLPAFNVTGLEAIHFAEKVCRGSLPSREQWAAAFGRSYDSKAASKAGYPHWQGRTIQNEKETNETTTAQLVGRKGNQDTSPWGVRDLGSNGMEYTRYDPDWGAMIPHQYEPSSMELRGRSFRDPRGLLTVGQWKKSRIPNEVFFGIREIDRAGDDIGFRVVIQRHF